MQNRSVRQAMIRGFATIIAVGLLVCSVSLVSLLVSYGASAGVILPSRPTWSCPQDREIVVRADGSVACAKDLIFSREDAGKVGHTN